MMKFLLAVDLAHLRSAEGLLQEAAAQAGRLVLGPDTPVRLEVGVGKSWWDAVLNAKEKKK
jgi:hypothetical protein